MIAPRRWISAGLGGLLLAVATIAASATGESSVALGWLSEKATENVIIKFYDGRDRAPIDEIDFGSGPAGQTVQKTITVENSGSSATSSLSIVLTLESDPSFAVPSTTCSGSLPKNRSCTFVIQFTRPETGPAERSASVDVRGANGTYATLRAEGSRDTVVTQLAPALSLSPSALVFPARNVGTASPAQVVTLTNTGTGPLAISGISASGDFAQSNGCAASIVPGAACSISVTFMPVAAGSRTGALTVASNAPGSPHSVSLAGTGVALTAGVSLSPATLTFAARDVGSTSSAQVVTLTNTGTGSLAVSGISASGDFAQSNGCGASIVAGGACTISVTFKPTGAGTRTGALTVTSNAPGGASVSLSGTGLALVPAVSLSAASLTFAARDVGTTSPSQVVTLTNTGTAPLAISGISASGDFSHTHACGSSVAAGGACTISVTFTPTASGARTGTLSMANNASGSPHGVQLSGAGTETVAILGPVVKKSFTPSSVVAGAVSTLTVSISNPNRLPMTGVGFTDTFPSGLSSNGTETNSCGGTVSGGASLVLSGGSNQANGGCEVSIPVMATAVGGYTNTLGAGSVAGTVGTSAVSNASATSAVLQVSAAPAPGVSIASASLSFGSVAVNTKSGSQRVTITNSGTATLNFSGQFAVTGPFAQVSGCPASLVPGQNCTVDVSFSPKEVGLANGSVSVASNAPGSPHSVALSGTGVAEAVPGVSLVPGSLTFGAQTVVTTSSAQTVTLSNTGSGPFAINAIGTTGDFAQGNNCAATLAPGASCTLNVTFRPLVVGARAGGVVVDSNAPGSPHTVGLTGHGAAPPVPGVTLEPGAVSFPDTQVGMAAAGITVVARNTGNSPLLISIVEIVGSGFRVVVHDCTAPVAAGAVCRIVVAFEPTTRGAASATLRVVSNAPSGPVTAGLVGTGIPAPLGALTANPGSLAFDGQVIRSTSALQTITLTNTGDAPINLGTVQVSGDFFQSNDCGRLPVNGLCTVTVSFTPTAVGVRTGLITITSDASNDVLVLGLSGTGLPLPASLVEISATSLSFGNTMVGAQSAGQSITVRNAGTMPLTIAGVSVVGDFEIANTCPSGLAAGGTCQIDVTFVPRVPGTRTGSVSVQSNATNATNGSSITLSGTGCRLSFANRSLNLACQ